MPGKDVATVEQALTADGTAAGYVTVADNSGFYKGADCFLSNGASSVEVIITEIGSGGLVGLKLKRTYGVLNAPNYGNSSMTAYTVAGGWKLIQPSQFIYSA